MTTSLRSLAAACCVVASPCAFAVNYPTELAVRVTDSLTGPPLLFVDFMNNEGDLVKFVFEASFDGVVQPRWPGTNNGDTACTKSADPHSCDGVPTGRGDNWSNTKGHRAAQVLRIERDTEYCFRVKANDGRHESPWTPQVCAHTPPLPRRPSLAPKTPQVTMLEQGTTGRGDVGGAKPAKVLVEWSANNNDVAWFAVERADAVSSPVTTQLWAEVGRVPPPQGSAGGDLEFVESISDPGKVPGPGKRVNYRVCAGNVGGKTCSSLASYPPAYMKESVTSTTALSRTPPRPVTATQTGAATARIASPQILLPTVGSNIVQGQLRLQVSAPGTEGSQAEVEFVQQEARPQRPGEVAHAAPATALWKTPMAALAKGALVPAGEGPTQAGVWVARVRSVRGATPDPWGEPVSFTVSVPVWVKAATTATLADTPTRAIAAPLAASPLQKAPTAMGAKPASSLDWGKSAPSAFTPAAPRSQP